MRNPKFRPEVWKRIQEGTHATTWTGFARAHRPTLAAVLAIAIVVGAVTGRHEASEKRDESRTALAANYVHALDARWMRQP